MIVENIGLKEISEIPSKIYIRLEHKFLISLLIKSSKCKKPHRNKNFCDKIDVKFNNKIKASPTLISWIRLDRAIPLSKIKVLKILSGVSWDKIESKIIGIKSHMAGLEINIKLPIKINKELGSIVGHILGDGSIDKKHQQVFYSNSNTELLNEFSYCMKKIFSSSPRIWMQMTSTYEGKTRWEKRLNKIEELKDRRNCGLFYPTICGVLLNMIFEDFSVGKEKKITGKVKNANKEFRRGLLRAFFDDESTVGDKSIRVFQDRKEILQDIKKFLEEFEITTKEIKRYRKREKDRYYLDIHRKSNLIKFKEKINFTSSKKRHKLQEISIIKNIKSSK